MPTLSLDRFAHTLYIIEVAGFDKYYSEKDDSLKLKGTSFNDNVGVISWQSVFLLTDCYWLAVEELRSDGSAWYT